MKTEFIKLMESLSSNSMAAQVSVEFDQGELRFERKGKIKINNSLTQFMITKKMKGVLFKSQIYQLIELSQEVKEDPSKFIFVPAFMGFKVYRVNNKSVGKPKYIDTIKFYSVKNKFLLWILTKVSSRFRNEKL